MRKLNFLTQQLFFDLVEPGLRFAFRLQHIHTRQFVIKFGVNFSKRGCALFRSIGGFFVDSIRRQVRASTAQVRAGTAQGRTLTFGGFTLRRNIAGAGHECVCSVADVIFIKCVGKCLANFGGCAFSSVADLHTRKLNRCSIYRGIKTPCHIRRNFGPKFGNFAQADLPSINDSFDRTCAEINDGSEDVLHNVGKFIPNNLNRVECADPTCDYEINVTLRKFYDNVSNVAELFAPTFRFAIYPINRRIPNAFNPFSGNARSIANISEGG